ncbi:MAG: PAS domain S-box protein, partial [Balneolaceae bacterium]
DVTEKLNAEREIELSEKRFRSLIQDGSDLIAILDEQANYTYVSPTSEAVLGIKAEDFIGTNVIEYIHPDYQKIVQESLVALELEHRIELSPFKFKDSVGNWRWIETKVTNMLNNAAVKGYVANSRDVTEKIEKQKELKESLERYSIVSKATSDTIWDLDLETNTLQYNNNLFSMFGYNKTKIGNIEHWWHKKIHPDDLKIVQKAITDVVKTGKERFNIEYRVKAADGTYKHVFNRAFVIKDENGKATRMIGAMQDVSQGVEEEERLKLLESVITNTAESVVITEAVPEELPGRKILYVNEAFSKQTGYEKSEVIGKTLSFLNGPETDQNTRKKLRASMENYETTEVDFINYKKNGEKFWNTISMVPVSNKEGKYTHWVAIGRDTTDQKQYEDEIKKSLLEKNTLLAEIHHRVKNNLAVVSGLMQLQAFETENEDLQAKLYDSVVRIRTMATVHELLYQSGSFSQLEFSDTLKKLVQNVSDTLQSANEIKVDIDCDPVILNINQAIPASLIVNEVITNAYKHAFKGCEKGEIKFKLSETNNQIHIEIKDNGVGLPDDFIQNNSTLGFHLIQILCQQINGEYSFNNSEKATTFLLEFSKTEIGVGGIPNN